MTRLIATALMLSLGAFVSGAAQEPAPPTFKAGVDLVSVSVTDAAPTVVSAAANTRALNSDITVTFSEPVDVSAINDWFVQGVSGSVPGR